jgi:hypothetical protein
MPAAAGGAGIVSPHVTVRKNSQQRAQGQIGKKDLTPRSLRIQRRPRKREEIRRCGHELALKNGAGLGNVGVKGFDDGGILLLDNPALEFEGEGEAAVVEGEILREESEAFDGFVLREMDGETLDLGVD